MKEPITDIVMLEDPVEEGETTVRNNSQHHASNQQQIQYPNDRTILSQHPTTHQQNFDTHKTANNTSQRDYNKQQ